MTRIIKIGSCALVAVLASAAFCASAHAGCEPPPTVPEIDPGTAVGALTLLVGGVLTLADRCRWK